MNPGDLRHNAVNWEFGMLVAPEHFLRQERFYEANMLWMLRYVHDSFGLIGGGPRLPASEFGAVKHDPIVILSEDEHTLRITVSQCRGLTAAGTPVDIAPEDPLQAEFPKAALEGVGQTRVYVTALPHSYAVRDGSRDEHNPQLQSERTRAYTLTLQPHGEQVQHAIAVSRLRRSDNSVAYEQDPSFIPPCIHLTAHSELSAAWRRIVEQLSSLSSRFIELHRAMQEYIELTRERGIDVYIDRETLEFVKRVVPAIEHCVGNSLNPIQSPAEFFANLRTFLQGTAVNLELSPTVRQYFDALRQAGETGYALLVEQQKQLLRSTRRWQAEDDLGVEVRSTQNSLRGLQTLERALEGKYIDFRVSPALDAMNFVFDRGGSALYKIAAKPARLQGYGEEMAFHFAGMRLEGREKYRVILTSEREDGYEADARVPVEIRINEGSGSRRSPIHGVAQVRFAGQKNVEFDFEASDIATVTDLRIAVPIHFTVRTALLFVRHRFYAREPGDQYERRPNGEESQRVGEPLQPRREADPYRAEESLPGFRPPLQAQPGVRPSWESLEESSNKSNLRSADNPANPVRRRRLE